VIEYLSCIFACGMFHDALRINISRIIRNFFKRTCKAAVMLFTAVLSWYGHVTEL
jgi:hypothetical protein